LSEDSPDGLLRFLLQIDDSFLAADVGRAAEPGARVKETRPTQIDRPHRGNSDVTVNKRRSSPLRRGVPEQYDPAKPADKIKR